jgi:2-dehydropantoate 2-reductase
MEFVVLGTGSLGSLLGGLLAREHAVTLVGREPHMNAVHESGLTVEGECSVAVSPDTTTDGTGHRADVALVTVKAFDTDAAARDLATGCYDIVCSLQNGIGNEATLKSHVDAHVVAGTTTYGARLTRPGRVECTGIGEVVLGSPDGGTTKPASRLHDAFQSADIDSTVAEDMPRRLWKKLAVNAGINATTALARVPNGALVDGPAGEPARRAGRETARVAQAHGIELDERTAAEAVEAVADTTAVNISSMLQDVRAGRRTEVDAINGAIVRRAANCDVDTPVNTTLARLLRAWETEQVE